VPAPVGISHEVIAFQKRRLFFVYRLITKTGSMRRFWKVHRCLSILFASFRRLLGATLRNVHRALLAINERIACGMVAVACEYCGIGDTIRSSSLAVPASSFSPRHPSPMGALTRRIICSVPLPFHSERKCSLTP
jgi:hypothetical protein